jgi:hypothetical protein
MPMLTRDEVLQLILYLIVATVLLLAGRVGAKTAGTTAESHALEKATSGQNDALEGVLRTIDGQAKNPARAISPNRGEEG